MPAVTSDTIALPRVPELGCSGAILTNHSGPALYGEGLQVESDLFLRDGFSAIGAGELGALRLVGAYIGGQLGCSGAILTNHSGPALHGEELQVDSGMLLHEGFSATGEDATVRLRGAHIGGQLVCSGATLTNDSGPALDADQLQVDSGMFLRDGFSATGAGEDVTVRLAAARIGGPLDWSGASVSHKRGRSWCWRLNGLTYNGIPLHPLDRPPEDVSAERWLELLRQETPTYGAQAYQQLAAVYRAAGHDRQVRRILMAQRDDQLARTSMRWSERAWGWITKVMLGYGYEPWRALLGLVGVLLVSCALAIGLGGHGALNQTDKSTTPGRPCTLAQQLSVSLDLNLPVGKSAARSHCDLTKDPTSVTATWLTAMEWVMQLLAWGLAALFIAGFTGVVRKT